MTACRKNCNRPAKSVSSVLGFNNSIYTSGFQESENVVNILSINSLLVNVDVMSGSYVNGSSQNSILSFQMYHQVIRELKHP